MSETPHDEETPYLDNAKAHPEIAYIDNDDRVCIYPCPIGRGYCHVPLKPHISGGWTWDGNREAPTLSPSVWCHAKGCEHHGFVRAGKWVPA